MAYVRKNEDLPAKPEFDYLDGGEDGTSPFDEIDPFARPHDPFAFDDDRTYRRGDIADDYDFGPFDDVEVVDPFERKAPVRQEDDYVLKDAFSSAIEFARAPSLGIGELVGRALKNRTPAGKIMEDLAAASAAPGLEVSTSGCEGLSHEFTRLSMVPTSLAVRCSTSDGKVSLYGLGLAHTGTLSFVAASEVAGYAISERVVPVGDVGDFFEKLVVAIAGLETGPEPVVPSPPRRFRNRIDLLSWMRRVPSNVLR